MTTRLRRLSRTVAACLLLTGGLVGCGVERTMVVNSNPPGALVYLNREEVGRTPLKTDFTWYGEYDIQVRKEGYQTLSSTEWVVAPWWQWPPFDFVAELVPGHPHDTHRLSYTLKPATRPADPEALVRRAEGLRAQLHSGEYPSSKPSTKPSTRSSKKRPTTKPA